MKRFACGVLLAVVAASAGCSLAYDALFGVFERHYTGGGVTSWDKQNHYRDRVEAWADPAAPSD